MGDEITIFKDEAFPFSVVTQSIVEVLCIHKSDLVTKVPKDVQAEILDKANQKLSWIKRRLIDICIGIEKVSQW